jgi:hypothetical protein
MVTLFNFGENTRDILAMAGAMNLGGACMDIYMVHLLLKEKDIIYAQDTETGIRIYRNA